MTDLREARILLRHRGLVYKACKVVFTKNDSSFYLVPYWDAQSYNIGKVSMVSQADHLPIEGGAVREELPEVVLPFFW